MIQNANQTQRGFSLIETTFVLALGSVGALAFAQYRVEQIKGTTLKAEAEYLRAISEAAISYTERNRTALLCGFDPTNAVEIECRGGRPAQLSNRMGGIFSVASNPEGRQPTVDRLRLLGDLQLPFDKNLRYTGTTTIRIAPDCPPAAASNLHCNLVLQIESGHPIYAAGKSAYDATDQESQELSVDRVAANALIQQLGGRAGVRMDMNGTTPGPYKGLQGGWSHNPPTASTSCPQLGCIVILHKTANTALSRAITTGGTGAGGAGQNISGDLKLWQTALSPSEIRAATGVGGPRGADIVNYTDLSDSGTTFSDRLTIQGQLATTTINATTSINLTGNTTTEDNTSSTATRLEGRNIRFEAIQLLEATAGPSTFNGKFIATDGSQVTQLRCDHPGNANIPACRMGADLDITCDLHRGEALFAGICPP